VDAFCARAAELAQKYGSGFALTAQVQDAIRRHQPVY
jgi:3-hydroxyacyl-CoA dehydrogenase / enoyl-CoA hydratase / 3-hydroxybutyryl-CoA epimerase